MIKIDSLKHLVVITIIACSNIALFSQTGPAGVGNATGASGQPHNLVWLDASDLTSFGAGDTWTDKSGNGHNAVNTAAPISLGTLNGEKALDFSLFTSGNLTIANHGDFNNVSQLSIFVVYNSGTSTNPQGLVSKRDNQTNRSFTLFQHETNQPLQADIFGTRVKGGANTSSTNYIANYIFEVSDSIKIYKNGVRDNNGWATTGAANLYNSSAGIEIGKMDAGYDAANNFKGQIAEIIIYKTNLSPLQRALVVSYLSNKYGITAQEANIAYSPTDGSYYEDLTGYAKTITGLKNFGPTAGLYLSLNDAVANDFITAAHNGALNQVATIQTGANVIASGAQAAWNRAWYVQKNGSSTARLSFSLAEGIEDGNFPQELANYVLLRKATPSGNYSQVTTSTKGIELGDRIYFEVATSDFEDGYFTLGTLNQSSSPLQGASTRIWYTLVGGDWDNWETWTLDPSGALPNNPGTHTPTTSPTAISDKVVILNGKTVTVNTNNKVHSRVTVNGRLELQGTTGHNFGEIWGNGRILLNSNNFPAGNAANFSTLGLGEGTVVYNGSSFDLTQSLTFFNLEIDLANASDELTLMSNIIVNGELRIKKGTLKFNDNSSVSAKNLTVYGDVTIEENGKILTGNGNARHQFNLHGNFTNNGTVEFTNRTAVNYSSQATNGIVDVNFLSATKNQTVFLNGPSRFYRIEIDKGTDATYELALEATNADHFKLFGYANSGHGEVAQLTDNTNALGLIRGTVRIKSNISIPVLNNTGNYNISAGARLWVDGGYAAKTIGTAIVPYGAIQVSAGTLDALVNSGITTRGNGLVKVEGGTLNMNQLRTSVYGPENVGGYVQSGGTTNVLGGSTSTDYYCFNLTYPGNVFNMSGGTLHIHQANTKGGIFIASDAVNQNVTGGKVILNIGNANNFLITSLAPFYNLELTKTVVNTAQFIVSDGNSVGAAPTVSLDVQSLKVLNDFKITGEQTADSYPDITFAAVTGATNVNDVYVGGSMIIERGVNYVARFKVGPTWYDNTTYFNQTIGTSAIDTFYYDHPANAILDIGHFILNRNHGNELRLVSSADRNDESITIDVNGNASVLSGTFDQGRLVFRIYGSITNNDRFGTYYSSGNYPVTGGTPSAAQIRFREDPPLVINTSDNAIFGNIRFNVNTATAVELNSDIYIERLDFMRGAIYLKNYNLKVDEIWNMDDNNFQDITNSSLLNIGATGITGNNIIYSDGKASDGGLSLKISSNTEDDNVGNDNQRRAKRRDNRGPISFLIGFTPNAGTTIYKRPAQLRVKNFVDDGYVTIKAVKGELELTDIAAGKILQHHWKVSYSDFTTLPNVAYRFYYYNQSGVSNIDLPTATTDEIAYVPGKVIDILPFTRSYESNPTPDITDVDESIDIRTITYNGTSNNSEFDQNDFSGFQLASGYFTAGVPNRFVGSPQIFYVRANGNWRTNNTWSLTRGGGTAGDYPKAGDVAVIRRLSVGYNGLVDITNAETCASVIFDDENGWASGCPRIIFNRDNSYAAYNSDFSIIEVAETHKGGTLNGETHGAVVLYEVNDSYPGTFPSGDFGNFNDYPNALVIWNHQGTNALNLPVTGKEYPQLWMDSNAKTYVFPNTDVTVNGLTIMTYNNVLRPNSAGGSVTFKKRLMLGHSFGAGHFTFPGTGSGSASVTVEGDLVMSQNASTLGISSPSTGGVIHNIELKSNALITGGNVNLGSGTGTNVNLKLSGETNNYLSNTGSGSITLYRVIMNKGIDQTNTFSFNNNFTLNGPTSGAGISKAIELQNGTLILNNAALNLNLTTGNDNFFIPGSAGITIQQGQANAIGNSGILLDGAINISGGKLNMSGGNNYIEYSATGNSVINISAGELIVGSQIRRGTASTEGILKYYQTGGKVVVGQFSAPQNDRGVFEILNSGSNFTFTGGELQIARSQAIPAFASVYLDPETSLLNDAAVLNLGNENTPATQTIGIYSNIEIPNLVVNNISGNNPTVRQWTVPLTISKLLQVDAGTTFNANALDLLLKGDMLMNGSFLANGNTTYFSGTGNQQITGSVNFYNLTKTSATNLTLNNNITVAKDLRHEAGLLIDGSNDVTVMGNLYFNGDHQWGGTGRGIVMGGTVQQTLNGSGDFGKLTINNPEGVKVSDGNAMYINNALQLEQGVLNVGSNLLTLAESASIVEGNTFSGTNMITTNASFTDNGVKKIFPAGTGLFTYPVGSGGKYTPVVLDITANTNAGASILVKPASEYHPSVIDANNVLQYHWILRANAVSGFSAAMKMKYDVTDVRGDINNYITARLLSDGTGEWNKFSGPDVIDEAAQELLFDFFTTDASGISGDYTAGLDAAIPNQVPTYVSKMNGPWNDASTWDTYPVAGGSVPGGGPRGSIVIVNHEVYTPVNYTSSYRTTIGANGVLSIGSTFGHRLGDVFGSGTLSIERGDLPAGFYEDFVKATGGTIRYGGSDSYDILSSLPTINNLELTGTGIRRFPNLDIQMLGDLTIDGPEVRNEQNKKISVQGDVVFDGGSFIAGTGATSVFQLNGTAVQTLSGTAGFSNGNKFNKLTVNNPTGVVFNIDADVNDVLTLTSGRVSVDDASDFRILNYNSTAIVGSSATRYIDGPLYKQLNSGATFEFPIGNVSRFGPIKVENVSVTGLWRAQYFNSSANDAGLLTNSMESPVQYVSTNEYWNIEAPAAATAVATVRWDAASGVNPVELGLRGVQWITDKWYQVTLASITGNATSGTAKTSSALSFNANAEGNFITFGAITIPAYTWSGAVDNDWFKTGNWSSGIVPSASATTTITNTPNKPVIAGSSVAQTNGLSILSGSTLTVAPGGKLTVNGNLSIVDAGALKLESETGADKLASLITKGTISGSTNIKLTLPANQWYYTSSAINDATLGNFSTGSAGAKVYVHRNNQWFSTGIANVNTATLKLEGTLVKYEQVDPKTLDYTGVPNTGTIERTYTSAGWYLMGNPFPSFINWQENTGWSRTNIDGTMWYRTLEAGNMVFVTYNRSAIPGARVALYPLGTTWGNEAELANIPPMQAVWVKALAPTSLAVNSTARTHGVAGSKLKSTSTTSSSDIIRVVANNGLSRDGVVIYFSEQSSNEMDAGDSEKRFNDAPTVPELFTRIGSTAAAINGLPLLSDNSQTIPLSVLNKVADEVTLNFDLSLFQSEHTVYLEDKVTSEMVNLIATPDYTYTPSTVGEVQERFIIHLGYAATTTGIVDSEGATESDITITGMRGRALVNISSNLLDAYDARIEVYTTDGRKVSDTTTGAVETLLTLPKTDAVFVVKVTVGDVVKTEKVTGKQ